VREKLSAGRNVVRLAASNAGRSKAGAAVPMRAVRNKNHGCANAAVP